MRMWSMGIFLDNLFPVIGIWTGKYFTNLERDVVSKCPNENVWKENAKNYYFFEKNLVFNKVYLNEWMLFLN